MTSSTVELRSEVGARGIAQIMPEYHPGVNYDDPVASINYAAKHSKVCWLLLKVTLTKLSKPITVV
jgi:hypothetical protein